MALTPDDVAHIARLARVGLTSEEKARLTTQLSAILDHFETLQQVDTEGVEPTAHPLPLSNVMRADEVQPSLPQAVAVANAPEREDALFRVRAVLE